MDGSRNRYAPPHGQSAKQDWGAVFGEGAPVRITTRALSPDNQGHTTLWDFDKLMKAPLIRSAREYLAKSGGA